MGGGRAIMPLLSFGDAEEWAAIFATKPVRLDAYEVGNMLVIADTRPCATRPRHIFTGLAARVYHECDTAAKVPSLARRLLAPEDGCPERDSAFSGREAHGRNGRSVCEPRCFPQS